MIDIETLAVPAFLVEILSPGSLVEARLNAPARSHPALVLSLTGGSQCNKNETLLGDFLRSCAVRQQADDLILSSPESHGTEDWRASLIPMIDQDGRVNALLGICRKMARQNRDPAWNSDHLSLALQAIHGAEWRYDVKRGVYEGSDEIATLFGESAPRPVTWAEWLERVYPQDLAIFLAAPALEGTVEFRFHACSGELRWARCSRVVVTGAAGEVEAVLGIMVDITRERIRETAWAELANHDPLTGLLNRRGLLQKIDRLQGELPPTSSLAMFVIDLDHFKTTNDTHGHTAGDAVLVEASRRLVSAADGRICARLGGDEFVVILPVSDEVEAYRLRDRLCQEFRRPLAFRGQWLPVSASVGVACVSGAIAIVDLMDIADTDLYMRKRGRSSTPAVAA